MAITPNTQGKPLDISVPTIFMAFICVICAVIIPCILVLEGKVLHPVLGANV